MDAIGLDIAKNGWIVIFPLGELGLLHRGSERQGFVASRFEILAAALHTYVHVSQTKAAPPTFEAGDVYKMFTDLDMCTIAVTPASMFASVLIEGLRAVYRAGDTT